MLVKKVGSNMTEVDTERVTVLVSYSTPVAFLDKLNGGYYRTAQKHSVTTSRHIKKWLDGAEAREMEQGLLSAIVKL